MKKKTEDFNENPPLKKSSMAYMVLRNIESGEVFWTSGGEYRCDWYDMVYQSDDLDEAKDFYMKWRYDKK